MKSMFDNLSKEFSKKTTKTYSTSFSLGILFLQKKLRSPIYSIYGFVRFADEIVDSFHGFNKKDLLDYFKQDTYRAINNKISLNPILNSFQEVVHEYKINIKWIEKFFNSMEMDLYKTEYNIQNYEQYILCSAEVVGLMCLHVFTEGDTVLFGKLKPYAMKLGAAFQKVNFLRDLKQDNQELGRTYFPNVDLRNFSHYDKIQIEHDIENDFSEALKGIKQLPLSSRNGVFFWHIHIIMFYLKE
jgi:phytoene synthase